MNENVDQTKLKEAKELFISIAAHKLLTPLTLIKWNLELLSKDEALSLGSKDKLKDISESIQKLDTFSNILLRIVQVQADENSSIATTRRSIEVNVSKALDKAVSSQKDLKLEKDISAVDGQTILLPISEDELAYIFNALFDNAVSYNVAQKTVQLKAVIVNGDLVLSFKDDGIGILANEKDLVGEAFFRTTNSQKLSVKGFGLSLYLIKLMLKNAGGYLQIVQSELEQGSVFEIKIPLLKKDN